MILKSERITLEFAKLSDKRLTYEMLISPEVIDNMFDLQHPAPTWQEFNEDESDDYFTGLPSTEGSYLLIKFEGKTIGSISYSNSYTKIIHSEIDIWISSTAYTGQGLGTEAIDLLMDYVYTSFSIDTFIIRPWKKNINAIKDYLKCGFEEMDNFNPEDFYSGENLLHYGDGDYGVNETVNLIKRYVNEV